MKRKLPLLSFLNLKASPTFPFLRVARIAIASCWAALMLGSSLQAVPYASNVKVTGLNVSFILNEPADVLMYRRVRPRTRLGNRSAG